MLGYSTTGLTQLCGEVDTLMFYDQPVAMIVGSPSGQQYLVVYTAYYRESDSECWVGIPVNPAQAWLLRHERVPYRLVWEQAQRADQQALVIVYVQGRLVAEVFAPVGTVPQDWWPDDTWANCDAVPWENA